MARDPTRVTGPPARRAFVIACVVGGVLALIGFVLVLHASPGGFFRRETFANFYDAQADAWLHGRWNVPANDLYIEGFRIGSKTYTYFGAWPSLLRLPVLIVSGSAYGHLTALSMTLAFATACSPASVRCSGACASCSDPDDRSDGASSCSSASSSSSRAAARACSSSGAAGGCTTRRSSGAPRSRWSRTSASWRS